MYRVALVGAGSVTFAQRIVNDLLFRPAFEDAEFRLMDIDESRLRFSGRRCRRLPANPRGVRHPT